MSRREDDAGKEIPDVGVSHTGGGEPESVELEPLWTAADVARYLRVTERCVYAWVQDKKIEHIKFCGVLRFDPWYDTWCG